MNGSQFTPGPWASHGVHVYGTVEPYGNVCTVGEPRATTTVQFTELSLGSKDAAEAFANARLIAAAPELYEALEHDIRFFDSIANDERWEGTGIANLCNGYATRRRELLARARGEQ